jgi:hypothetical protein
MRGAYNTVVDHGGAQVLAAFLINARAVFLIAFLFCPGAFQDIRSFQQIIPHSLPSIRICSTPAMEASAAENWSNLPIGAPWTPSMILGAQLHDRAQDEYYADLTRQNGVLAEEVALCNIRLNAANTMATRQQVLISRFVFFYRAANTMATRQHVLISRREPH